MQLIVPWIGITIISNFISQIKGLKLSHQKEMPCLITHERSYNWSHWDIQSIWIRYWSFADCVSTNHWNETLQAFLIGHLNGPTTLLLAGQIKGVTDMAVQRLKGSRTSEKSHKNRKAREMFSHVMKIRSRPWRIKNTWSFSRLAGTITTTKNRQRKRCRLGLCKAFVRRLLVSSWLSKYRISQALLPSRRIKYDSNNRVKKIVVWSGS